MCPPQGAGLCEHAWQGGGDLLILCHAEGLLERSHPMEGAKHPKPTQEPVLGPQQGETSVLATHLRQSCDKSHQALLLETAYRM